MRHWATAADARLVHRSLLSEHISFISIFYDRTAFLKETPLKAIYYAHRLIYFSHTEIPQR
jgi:hypothetical protein